MSYIIKTIENIDHHKDGVTTSDSKWSSLRSKLDTYEIQLANSSAKLATYKDRIGFFNSIGRSWVKFTNNSNDIIVKKIKEDIICITNVFSMHTDELAKYTEIYNKFTRKDIKKELTPLYEYKNELYVELSTVKADLYIAYEEIKDINGDIQSWHDQSSRSQWLGGSKGKNIPQHSWFGQSYDDLNDLQSIRDNIGDSIGHLKTRRSDIHDMISEVKRDISILKEVRSKL